MVRHTKLATVSSTHHSWDSEACPMSSDTSADVTVPSDMDAASSALSIRGCT